MRHLLMDKKSMKGTLLIVAAAAVAATVGPIGPACAGGSPADARNVMINTQNGSSWVDTQSNDHHDRRERGPEAVLFSNPDFNGDRWVINGDYLPDLANTGFNDRAQSLRVRSGYWIFCSDAQFRGQCRTFGPGDYPRLGWALDNKVSSGRRISDRYPYSGQPNWGDRRR